MEPESIKRVRECARKLNSLGIVQFADQMVRWIDFVTSKNRSVTTVEMFNQQTADQLAQDIKKAEASSVESGAVIVALITAADAVKSAGYSGYKAILNIIESATGISIDGEQEDTTTLIAYFNKTGSEQTDVTVIGDWTTELYDKSGQKMTYDATKAYTVTECCALGMWQPNDAMFRIIRSTNDDRALLTNYTSNTYSLAAIKYTTKDLVKMYYLAEGGQYFPQYDSNSTRYVLADIYGNSISYDISKKYKIMRGHNVYNDTIREAISTNINIINVDGVIYAERTHPSSSCFSPDGSYKIDYLWVLVEDL